jgi:hypothetical protein
MGTSEEMAMPLIAGRAAEEVEADGYVPPERSGGNFSPGFDVNGSC